jgi:hypothetical protein
LPSSLQAYEEHEFECQLRKSEIALQNANTNTQQFRQLL